VARLPFTPLLALASLALACAPPPPELVVPRRALVTERAHVCAPGRDWSAGDDGGWQMRGLAEVPCWFGAAADGTTFWWTTDGERLPLRFTWDGEVLDGVYADRHGWRVDVPAERSGAGHHLLEVRRLYAGAGRSGLSTRLTGFGMVEDGRRVPFDPGREAAYEYLGDFLVHGGTGLGPQKRTGVLALGPGEVALPLVGTGTGTGTGTGYGFEVEVENASPSPARFTAAAGEATEVSEVAAGETALLRLPLAAADRVRLAVDGDADGLFLFGAPRVTGRSAFSGPPPLVVVLTLDTTRRDALGSYGSAAGATPRLDEFAASATVFENALSTAPWTLPAHASMFTGLYPSRHGAGVGEGRRLAVDGPPTAAEAYAAAGYLTAGFCGGHLVEHRFGVGRGFALYRDAEPATTPADRLTDRVLALLAERAAGDDGFEPTFLFVNYFDPHWPYRPPAEWGERFAEPRARQRVSAGPWRRATEGTVTGWTEVNHGRADAGLEDLVWLRAAYHAEVAFMDAEVGRLFDALRQMGVWDEALVVVTADHGELLGEGGYFGHAYRLDPELVEVPLVVKWPGQRQGRRVERLVSGVDLFPTLLTALGSVPPPSDGVPL